MDSIQTARTSRLVLCTTACGYTHTHAGTRQPKVTNVEFTSQFQPTQQQQLQQQQQHKRIYHEDHRQHPTHTHTLRRQRIGTNQSTTATRTHQARTRRPTATKPARRCLPTTTWRPRLPIRQNHIRQRRGAARRQHEANDRRKLSSHTNRSGLAQQDTSRLRRSSPKLRTMRHSHTGSHSRRGRHASPSVVGTHRSFLGGLVGSDRCPDRSCRRPRSDGADADAGHLAQCRYGHPRSRGGSPR